MKKLIILLCFLLFSNSLTSQNNFGVFVGPSNTTLTNGFLKAIAFDKAFGFHLGALYEHELNKKIAFRPKLMFSLQGDRKEGTGGSGNILDTSLDYKLTYINAPLNFKFFSKPYIIAGPQIGYLIGTKKGELDIGNIEHKFDYGVNFGFGYDISKLFIEFNMYQGIAKLIEFEPSDDYMFYSKGITNTVLQLSVGYYLN